MALLQCFGELYIYMCISRHNALDLEIDSPNAIGWKLYIFEYIFWTKNMCKYGKYVFVPLRMQYGQNNFEYVFA